MIVALLVNALDDTAEVPSIHLPHEGGHVTVLKVFSKQPSLEFVLVDNLPGPTVGKPDDDALGLWIGEERVELHGEGRFPLGIGPPGSGVGVDIGGCDAGVIVVEILLDGVDHLGVGGGSSWGTGTAGGGGTVSRGLGSCCGSHRSSIEAGEATCTARRRHEGGEVVEIDIAWKTHACLLFW